MCSGRAGRCCCCCCVSKTINRYVNVGTRQSARLWRVIADVWHSCLARTLGKYAEDCFELNVPTMIWEPSRYIGRNLWTILVYWIFCGQRRSASVVTVTHVWQFHWFVCYPRTAKQTISREILVFGMRQRSRIRRQWSSNGAIEFGWYAVVAIILIDSGVPFNMRCYSLVRYVCRWHELNDNHKSPWHGLEMKRLNVGNMPIG